MMEKAIRIESFIIVSIFPALEVLCYVLLCMKRNELAVRKRSVRVVLFASIGGWLAYLNLIFSVTNRGGNCGVFYVFSILIPPIATGSQLIRAIQLRSKLERSSILLKEERVQSRRRASLSHGEKLPLTPGKNNDGGSVGTVQASASLPTSPRAGSICVAGKEKLERSRKETKSALMVVSWLILFVPTVLLLLATLSASSVSGVDAGGLLGSSAHDDCYAAEPISLLHVCPAIALFVVLLTLVTTALIRKREDELGIRSEITRNAIILGLSYIAILIVRLVGRRDLHPLLEAIQQLLLSVSMKLMPCFRGKAETLLSWATGNGNLYANAIPGYARPLPKVGRRRSLRRNSAKDIELDNERRRELTMSLDAGLCVLLSTEDGINSFSEHCVREFSYENIRFWCAVNDFHAEVDLTCIEHGGGKGGDDCGGGGGGDDDGDGGGGGDGCANHNPEKLSEVELLDFAKEIYGVYIATEGELQVNIPSALVAEIKDVLEKGDIRRDMFDNAQREIFNLMSRDSYPRYLATKRKTQTLLEKSRSTRKKSASAISARKK